MMPRAKLSTLAALATLLGACAYLFVILARNAGHGVNSFDIYFFFYPVSLYAAESIRHGGSGLFWNALQNCGQPFLGSGVSGVLYPPFLFFLILAPDLALHAHLFFTVAVGTIGAYLLCRELGVETIGAVCGGLAFGFSNAAIDQITSTPLMSGPYSWLPAAMLLTERLLRAPSVRGGIALGVVLTLALLPGHPQPLLYIYQVIALRTLYEIATRRFIRMKTLGTLLIGLALPAMLGAVHLLPALEVMRASVRSGDLSLDEITTGTLFSWEELRRSLFWRRDLFNPVVVAPLMLASAAVFTTRFRRVAAFYALTGALSLDLSMGSSGFLFPFYIQLPLGTLFRAPFRYLWIVEFCVAVLVAIGVDTLVSWSAEAPQRLRRLGAVILPASVLVLLHWWVPNIGGAWQEQLIFAVVFAGCLTAVTVPAMRRMAGAMLVAAIILSNLVFRQASVRSLLPSGDALYAKAPVFRFLQQRITPQDRIYVVPKEANPALQQKSGSLFGIPALFDYESLATRRFAEFYQMLHVGRPLKSLNDFYYPIVLVSPSMSRRLLDLAAVRYLVFDPSISTAGLPPPPFVPILDLDGVRVFENTTALPRARWVAQTRILPRGHILELLASPRSEPTRTVVLEEEPQSGFLGGPPTDVPAPVVFERNDPEHLILRVDAPQRGFLVLADQWFPGWRARVNGTPTAILRADYLFRTIEVPAGASTVEFTYVPVMLYLGAGISATTLVAIGIVLWRTGSRVRDDVAAPETIRASA